MKREFPEGIRWAGAPHALLDEPRLSPGAKLLYWALATYSGYEDVFPSVGALAKKTAQSTRWVQLKRRELEESGWVEIVPRVGRTNLYHIVLDPRKTAGVALKNRRRLATRRAQTMSFRKAPVRGVTENSEESESGFIPPGVNRDSSKKYNQKYRSKNKATWGGDTPPGFGSEPIPSYTWPEMASLASQLLGDMPIESIHEWLIDLIGAVQARDPILTEHPEYAPTLAGNALSSVSSNSDFDGQAPGSLAELKARVLSWVDKYISP